MKTRFKRVFSLVLAVLMLVPIFSSFVFAKENVDVTNVPQNIASAADITVVEGLTWSGWKPENLVDGDATTGTYSPRGKAYAIELSFIKPYYFSEFNVLINREGTLPNVEVPEKFSDTTEKIKIVAYNGAEKVYESDIIDTTELDVVSANIWTEADRVVISAPEVSESALGCEAIWEIEAYSRTTPGVCDAETENVAKQAILTAIRKMKDADGNEIITNKINNEALEWWATDFKALTDGDIRTGTKSPKAPDFILQFDYGAERMFSSVKFTTNGAGTAANSGEIGIVKNENGEIIEYKPQYNSYTMTIYAYDYNDDLIFTSESVDVSSLEEVTFNLGVKASKIWCSVTNAGGPGYNGQIHMWEVEILEESGSHALEKTSTKNPSCVAQGYNEFTCQDPTCGYSKKEAIAPTGFHSWSETYKVIEAATEEENGKAQYVCTICSETIEREIPALNHAWDSGTVIEPDCVTEGYTIYKCTDCTLSYKTNFISALGHNLDDGIIDKKATLDETGLLIYSCLRDGCDHTEEKILRKARYSDSTFKVDSSIVDRYESSQTVDSNYAENAFAVIGKHVLDGVTNAGANGFDMSESINYWFAPGTPEQKDKDGNVVKERQSGKLYIYLNNEYYFTKGSVYAAANYRWFEIHFQYQDGSGNWVDSASYRHDRLDNKIVSEYNFTGQLGGGARTSRIVIESVNGAVASYAPAPQDTPGFGGNLQIHELILEAHKCDVSITDHKDYKADEPIEDAKWNNATCTNDGSCEVKCPVCNIAQTIVLPKEEYGHSFGTVTPTVAPTCSASGIGTAKCTNCTFEKTDIVIPKTGAHDYSKKVTFVEPTCNSKGIEQIVCVYCGSVELETPIEATGIHIFDWIQKSQSNYTAEGTTIHACVFCGEKSGQEEDIINEKLPIPEEFISFEGFEIRTTDFVGLRAKFSYDLEIIKELEKTCDVTITVNVTDSDGNTKAVEVYGKHGTRKYDKETGEFAVVVKSTCTEEYTFGYTVKLRNFRGTVEQSYDVNNAEAISIYDIAYEALNSDAALPTDYENLYKEIVAEKN